MGYLSFDASIKIHKSGKYTSTKTKKSGHGGVYGYIRHIDRGTAMLNGCDVSHSNTEINPELTLLNQSYYKDNKGSWWKTKHTKNMVNAVNYRLDYAKEHGARISSKGQNDSTILRPLVVQLDNEAIKGHEDTWQWDIIDILEEDFGMKNITGFSIHRDETNVHLHILFVPCYETKKENGEIKCTLSQTKFFKNPTHLISMHKNMRKKLCDKGYDVEQENKPLDEHLAGYYDKQGQWHQQGLTPDQLKQLTEKEIKLKMEEIEMKIRMEDLNKLEMAMQKIQMQAKEQQAKLDKERAELQVEKIEFENKKTIIQEQRQTLIQEKEAVEQAKEEAKVMLEEAENTAYYCSMMLNDKKQLSPEFIKFLDQKSKREKKAYLTLVENLYNEFLDVIDKKIFIDSGTNDNDAMTIHKEYKQTEYERPLPNVKEKLNLDDIINAYSIY